MRAEELAYALNGGADGQIEMFEDLVQNIRTVSACEPLGRWLAGRLTTVDIVELATRVAVAEPDYVLGDPVTGNARWHDQDALVTTPTAWDGVGLVSDEAKAVVTLMYLRGFEPAQIGLILVLPVERVQNHIRSLHFSTKARTAIKLALKGTAASVVAERTGLHRSTVYELLDRAGLKPPSNVTPEVLRDKAVRLRAKGYSYEQIRKATGLSTNVLRKAFQRAASRGLLADYGRKVAS